MVKQIGASNAGATDAAAAIFQFESGLTINEATTIALKSTIEASVVELIKEGQRKGVWDYNQVAAVTPNPASKGDPTIPLGMSNKSGTPADIEAKMGVVK
jgi:hypothetical protein